MFHRQSDDFITQAIKDTIPYFFGAISEEALALENERSILKRKLTLEKRKLEENRYLMGGGSEREMCIRDRIVIDFVYKLEQKSKVEIEKIYKKLIYNDNLYLVDTNYFSEFISSIDNNKTLDNIIKFCMSKRAGKVEVAV